MVNPMAKKIFLSLAIVLFLVGSITSGVKATHDSFSLDRLVVVTTINKDGTMSVDYTFDFTNSQGADPLDYVDVGLPVSDYDLHSITADVNGHSISDIQKSGYVDIGVALGLGEYAIQPGQTGRVHTPIGAVKKMIYPYTFINGAQNFSSKLMGDVTSFTNGITNATNPHLRLQKAAVVDLTAEAVPVQVVPALAPGVDAEQGLINGLKPYFTLMNRDF
jgi:hypothetical protein